MNIFKKLSALFLALLMVISLVPAAVLAEEGEDPDADMEQYIEDSLLEGEDELLGEEDIEMEDTVETPEGTTPKAPEAEEAKNISEVIAEPKLSGVDFINVYEEGFEPLRKNLLAFGIFSDENIEGEDPVTRAEFAVMIARILNNAKPVTDTPHRFEFKDVDNALAYGPSVNMLANYAIVEGDGNGNFHPERELTGGEAIIMLLNTLGYYEVAHIRGEGDTGYRNLANEMKFVKDVAFSYEQTVNLATAAKLIYRALHERVVEDAFYSGGNVTFNQSSETLMHKYMGVLTIDGIVTANEYTSLYSPDEKTSENSIEINGTVLSFDDESIEPYNYLGLYARVYYRDDSGNTSALFIEALDNRYDFIKIKADDIEGYDAETRTLRYMDGDTEESEKLPIDANIIFNNELLEGAIDARYFTPDAGQIVLIDNNRDKKYDVVIIDSYSTYVAKSAVTSNNENLFDDLSMQPGLNLQNKTIKVYKNNEKADILNITSGNVVLVASEKVTYEQIGSVEYQKVDLDSKKLKLIVSDYALTGKLESLDDEYLYIDNVTYEYSKSFLATAEKGENNKTVVSRRIGVNVSGAYDICGNIVWMTRGSDENVKYGVIIRVAKGKSDFEPNVMRFYSQDSLMEAAEFADKVKVHAMWDSGELNSSTYYAKTINGKEITTEVPGLLQNGKTVRQIMRYKINDEGKISILYLPATDERDYKTDFPMLEEDIFYHSDTITGDTSYFQFGTTGIMSSYYTYRKNISYGFKVPADDTIDDEKYFKAYTPTNDSGNPFTHNSKPKNLKLYNLDGGVIGAFIQFDDTIVTNVSDTGVGVTCGSSGPSLVIQSVKMTKNEETDEYVPIIEAWKDNKRVTYTFVNGTIVSNPVYTKRNKAEKDEVLSEIHPSELHTGDIIVVHLNKFNEIDGFSVAHRPKFVFDSLARGEIPRGYEKGYSSSYGGYYYESTGGHMYISGYHRGRVIRVINSAPIIATQRAKTDAEGNTVYVDVFRRLILNNTANQLLIYDYKNDTLTLTQGTRKAADFTQLEEGDYLFWHQKVFNTQTSVAVRNYQ